MKQHFSFYCLTMMVVLLLQGCTGNDTLTLEDLQGNWRLVQEKKPEIRISPPTGFYVGGDTFDFCPGWIDGEFIPGGDSLSGESNAKLHRVEVRHDSIFIYSIQGHNPWYVWKATLNGRDTLKLRKEDGGNLILVRVPAETGVFTFDRIVFAYAWGWELYGFYLSLDRNGQVFYSGNSSRHENRIAGAQLPAAYTAYLFKRLEQIYPQSLAESYSSNYSDQDAFELLFIGKGEIKKSVRVYGNAAPPELLWIATPLLRLAKELKGEPLPPENDFSQWFIESSVRGKARRHYFNDALKFWLAVEMRSAVKTNQTANPVYRFYPYDHVNYMDPHYRPDSSERSVVHTDGRYFTFLTPNRDTFSLDAERYLLSPE